MPYDDDYSRFGFRDWWELEAILREYFATEDLTLGRIKAVIQTLGNLATGREIKELSIYEVEAAPVKQQNLSGLPVETVVGLLDAIEPIAHHG